MLIERTARLQRAGRGAADGQVLPDGLDLRVRNLHRADGGLLGLRSEPEPRGPEGLGCFLGEHLWCDAHFSRDYIFKSVSSKAQRL